MTTIITIIISTHTQSVHCTAHARTAYTHTHQEKRCEKRKTNIFQSKVKMKLYHQSSSVCRSTPPFDFVSKEEQKNERKLFCSGVSRSTVERIFFTFFSRQIKNMQSIKTENKSEFYIFLTNFCH